MTIVHYRDKRTGRTQVYESTPHYDPKTKQSRPRRKYLGTLDPETGELIPSSGRRGRRPGSRNLPKGPVPQPADDGDATPPPAVDAPLAEAGRQRDELARRVEELERELERCREALFGVADVAADAASRFGRA